MELWQSPPEAARLLFLLKLEYETMVIVTAQMSPSELTVWDRQPKEDDKLNAGNRCVVKEEQRQEKGKQGTVVERF